MNNESGKNFNMFVNEGPSDESLRDFEKNFNEKIDSGLQTPLESAQEKTMQKEVKKEELYGIFTQAEVDQEKKEKSAKARKAIENNMILKIDGKPFNPTDDPSNMIICSRDVSPEPKKKRWWNFGK